MTRIRTCLVAAAAAGAVGAAPVAAGAVTAAPTVPAGTASHARSIDVRFARANEQTNLAEIALGKLALQRSHRAAVRHLAHVTIRDHRAARAELEAVAGKEGIALPERPNAQQRAAVAKLRTAHAFNRKLLRVEIAGHKLSIAQTRKELANGRNKRVRHYARAYLPVAKMHLRMARRDLRRVTG